jgi:hypothetical protein
MHRWSPVHQREIAFAFYDWRYHDQTTTTTATAATTATSSKILNPRTAFFEEKLVLPKSDRKHS